jgi:hypothetical protein
MSTARGRKRKKQKHEKERWKLYRWKVGRKCVEWRMGDRVCVRRGGIFKSAW